MPKSPNYLKLFLLLLKYIYFSNQWPTLRFFVTSKPAVTLECLSHVSYAYIKCNKVLKAVNANDLQIDYNTCHIESETRM